MVFSNKKTLKFISATFALNWHHISSQRTRASRRVDVFWVSLDHTIYVTMIEIIVAAMCDLPQHIVFIFAGAHEKFLAGVTYMRCDAARPFICFNLFARRRRRLLLAPRNLMLCARAIYICNPSVSGSLFLCRGDRQTRENLTFSPDCCGDLHIHICILLAVADLNSTQLCCLLLSLFEREKMYYVRKNQIAFYKL